MSTSENKLPGLVREYSRYSDYVEFQKLKTSDPVRRAKWLNQEWDLKLNGFLDEFRKLIDIDVLEPRHQALCLGARTGQEVEALRQLGVEAVGIDLVPCKPLVVEGDIHNLEFEDMSFDFVFSNILDHSIDPMKMASEAERVTKPSGHIFLQTQIHLHQDEFTEFVISKTRQVIELFEGSECIMAKMINKDSSPNTHGMNYEFLFRKREQ